MALAVRTNGVGLDGLDRVEHVVRRRGRRRQVVNLARGQDTGRKWLANVDRKQGSTTAYEQMLRQRISGKSRLRICEQMHRQKTGGTSRQRIREHYV